MDRRKSYPDLRYLFVRGLIGWEVHQRSHHFLKSASEWTSKAIVSIDLSEEPVKSIKQASQLDGVGKEICKKLRDFQAGILISKEPPTPGKFVSSAPAMLITVLIAKQRMITNEDISPDKCYIPEDTIKMLAPTICEERFQHINSDREVFCPALWRLNVMCTKGYIKKRSVNKQPAYELLPPGERIALRLKDQHFEVHSVPNIKTPSAQIGSHSQKTDSPSGSTSMNLTQHANQLGKQNKEDALYTNDDRSDGLVLLVDMQEWGGDRVGLGELIRLIERYPMIRYKTRKLQSGDYSWIWRCGEDEMVLPLLIERKRVDDLARSLRDGRYINQKEKMVTWKSCFENKGVACSLKYLIESKPEQYAVRCMDGCGAVVKCGFPTVKQLKVKIEEINADPNFELVETEDIAATVQYLDSIHMELQRRLNKGDFDELLYKQIDPNKDIGKSKKLSTQKCDNANKENKTKDKNVPQSIRKNNEVTKVIVLEDSQSQNDSNEIEPELLTKELPRTGFEYNPGNLEPATTIPLEQSESQEMLDVPLGQYHCSGDSSSAGTPKNTPKDATASIYDSGELPYVRAKTEGIAKKLHNEIAKASPFGNIRTKYDSSVLDSRKSNFSLVDEPSHMKIQPTRSETLLDLIDISDNIDQDAGQSVYKSEIGSITNKSVVSKPPDVKSNQKLSPFISSAKAKADSSLSKSDVKFCSGGSSSQYTQKATGPLLLGMSSKNRKRTFDLYSSHLSSSSESADDYDDDIIPASQDQSEDCDALELKTSITLHGTTSKKNKKLISLSEATNSIGLSSSEKLPSLKLTPNVNFTANKKETCSTGKIYRMRRSLKKKLSDEVRCDDTVPRLSKCSSVVGKNDNFTKVCSQLPDLEDSDDCLPQAIFSKEDKFDLESHNTNIEEGNADSLKKDSLPDSSNTSYNDSMVSNRKIPRKYRRQIEQILSIIPSGDIAQIQTLLELYGGNADMVVSAMFEESSQNM